MTSDEGLIEEIAARVAVCLRLEDRFLAGFVLGQAKWMIREFVDPAPKLRAIELVDAAYRALRADSVAARVVGPDTRLSLTGRPR